LKNLPLFALALLSCFHSSCSYRLSNSSLRSPGGISTIYIESIFDTSSVVLPHDNIWEELQRSAISSGKIKLASRLKADAHLTTHIVHSEIVQTDPVPRTVSEDPSFKNGQPPPSYREYRNLNSSSKFANKENLNLVAVVQLIDRRSGKSIFKKEYNVSRLYPIVDTTTERANRFQRADEAFEKNFQLLSEELAATIIGDILTADPG